MKKLLLLLLPAFSFAQITYQDIKYIADNQSKTSIDYIKSKGFTFESSEVKGNDTTIHFNNKQLKTFLTFSFIPNKENIIILIFDNKKDVYNLTNTIEKIGYKYIDSSYNDGICNKYESTDYSFQECETKFENELMYEIIFYKKIKNNE
ncbi:hypothetical protein [Empedobacter brevis]|uniref:hypothetical protein n=1 Tax=Empedobacter brevis TaxID=247 RepID=UPI0028A9B6C2|nr:hypothetical protein [Empedobacter brevis]